MMMSDDLNVKYSVKLSFEEVKFPPFDEILILGRKCPQGRVGVYKSFEFLVPNEYEAFESEDKSIESVFISKRLLKKIKKEKIFKILQDKVFPYVSESEILKVDFKLTISYDTIEITDDY